MLFHRKLKSSSSPRLLFCCFHDGRAAAASSDCDDGNRNCRMAARSPCSWLRSTARELPLPEIRHRRRSLVAWIGSRRWRQGHAAAAASEFGSNPMSYVLNFEDDWSPDSDEEFPARNFLARLPESPDWLLPGKLPREGV